jgi:hypothetical protein
MAYQIAQTISDPGTAPQRTDPDNFDTRADAFLTVLSLWGAATTGELIVLTAQMNALSTAVDGYSTDAETAQTAAEAAQAAAESAANTAAWNSGTTYASGNTVYGTDFLSYRSAQGSNTNHNPVGDDGTWWVGLKGAIAGINTDITSMTGLDDDGIPLAKVATAAGSGANSDITSMTGLSDDGIPHAKIADLQGNKNAIINGDFNIWQRGTSFAAIASGAYSADRYVYHESGDAVVTISRDTDVPTQAESGHYSNYSMKLDCTTVDASIGAGDYVLLTQVIEGYNYAPIKDKTATLSFWVKAVKTGIYCVSFLNSSEDRSYVAEYTINSASTWEKKTVTATFDASGGTWDYTNGTGLKVRWTLAAGSTYQGVADTWNSASDYATSNQVNGVDHTDNNFWLAQVQLELGSVATDFEYRNYGTELAKCQRYYYRKGVTLDGASTPVAVGTVWNATTTTYAMGYFPTTMRTAPTMSTLDGTDLQVASGSGHYPSSNVATNFISKKGFEILITHAAATVGHGAVVRLTATAGDYIDFSAEL